MAGYFILKRSGDQFLFVLKAGNHETILTSERYTTKRAAHNGMESVKKNAPDDGRYRRLVAKNDAPYFTLAAANGEVIGQSQLYNSAAARDNGIESVKKHAPTADIRDETDSLQT
ncbi:YegP family protein [Kerstersia gyiorum]|uniref:DUF1508 domain-containing protein n=1 Tax=Kerstersia gyiorum TaxID=206506 RepID=A0A171KPY3_9BURK|nr:YegP family protein [Kerstersia gyiorum]AZV95129.1 hypothetical protein CBF45_16515 [Bordetella sp. J329]KKO70950.1 hypothetical protein AAV32_13190 [Kerstersia gyiorum]MCH4271628.1 YegP family protein [Kerstersia gyiorum]MCI1228936.1 YegP family protein [Kerstersia gyiorum]MCP1631958.1 uncharacterized protein YegP (UPF0339 family) [Kerstersia gyiorum]